MAVKLAVDHPEFFKLSPQDQETVREQDFKLRVEAKDSFKAMSPEDQESARLGHKQVWDQTKYSSEHNPDVVAGVQAQQQADRQGLAGNTIDKAIKSHVDTLGRIQTVDDLFGSGDKNLPGQISKRLLKQDQAPITREAKELGTDIATLEKRLEQDGFINDAMAWGSFVGDVVTNPGAILDVAAESAASMTVGGVGAWFGGQAGAVAGPGGAAVGAAGGMFAAMTADAATSKLDQQVRETLTERGLAFSPENIISSLP